METEKDIQNRLYNQDKYDQKIYYLRQLISNRKSNPKFGFKDYNLELEDLKDLLISLGTKKLGMTKDEVLKDIIGKAYHYSITKELHEHGKKVSDGVYEMNGGYWIDPSYKHPEKIITQNLPPIDKIRKLPLTDNQQFLKVNPYIAMKTYQTNPSLLRYNVDQNGNISFFVNYANNDHNIGLRKQKSIKPKSKRKIVKKCSCKRKK
jgi:hypothetical protein